MWYGMHVLIGLGYLRIKGHKSYISVLCGDYYYYYNCVILQINALWRAPILQYASDNKAA